VDDHRAAWLLAAEYETHNRASVFTPDFYDLYHVLNHCNLFGTSYLNQAQRIIGRLLAELHA
jgi:fructosamine-3-kinase